MDSLCRICVYVRVNVCARECMCVCVCEHECIWVCVRARLHSFLCTTTCAGQSITANWVIENASEDEDVSDGEDDSGRVLRIIQSGKEELAFSLPLWVLMQQRDFSASEKKKKKI